MKKYSEEMLHCLVASLCALALLLGGATLAQEAGENDLQVFIEQVDVDVVNVDVHVTDRKGNPILGLSPADFQLFEDGRPLPISNFYAVEPGGIRSAGDETEISQEPVSSEKEESTGPNRAEPLPIEQRLHAVLFIDHLNLSPTMRNRVMKDLRPFVADQLRPGDRVMVAAFNRAVEVVQEFTDDSTAVLTALDELSEKNSMAGAVFHLERQGILRDIAEAQLPVSTRGGQLQGEQASLAVSQAASIYSSIQTYAQRHQNQTFVTLSALSNLVDSLAGLPGRKAVIYVSEGLSLRPGETLFRAWENKFLALRDGTLPDQDVDQLTGMTSSAGLTSMELNVERAFQEVARRASARRVTFYGLRPANHLSISAETDNFDFGALDTPGGGQAYNVGLASLDAANRGGSMRMLADITGGFAITNAGAFRVALERLRNDFNSYYSLGYTPNRERDGKKHKIEVRVPGRKSLVVRHREHYHDRDRGEKMREQTLATLVYGEVENPLAVNVDVATSIEGEKGHRRVPVLVKVPLSNVALMPRDENMIGLLSIHVGARDQQGRTSPIRSVKVPITIARAELKEAAGRMAGHHFMLEMYNREHEVTVGVRDEIADVESFAVVTAAP